jgi:hypothetical protein
MLPTPPSRPDWRTWGLVPLLILVSAPFLQALTHGQNTFISLLLLTVAVTLWRSRRGYPAGLVIGLLCYKPQLAALAAIILCLDLGWRAAAGFATTAAALFLITLVALPGSLGDYLYRLPSILHFMQVESPYIWERHATLRAFWRLLLQGHAAGAAAFAVNALTVLCSAALGAGLLWAARRTRRTTNLARRSIARDRLIAAAVVAMPLVMPFYFDYDLLLLAIPAVMLAAESLAPAMDRPARAARPDRWLVRIGLVLFVWLTVNPDVADATRVNFTVVLLSAVAALTIRRALRSDKSAAAGALPERPDYRLAA